MRSGLLRRGKKVVGRGWGLQALLEAGGFRSYRSTRSVVTPVT